jgi:stage II sporulation protein M
MKKIIDYNFVRALKYIKESKNFIYASIILFVVGALFGYFSYTYLDFLDKTIIELIKKTEGLNGVNLIAFIFLNNSQAAFLALVLGVILGIFPIFAILMNGTLIGYVLHKVALAAGFTEFWKLLPHGIFELPAIVISFSLGIKLGFFIFSNKKIKNLKRRFYEGLNVFVFVVLPLLIVAAIIEGTLISLMK